MTTQAKQTAEQDAPSRRALRRRRGFRMPPRPAVPVRALWEAASPESRERAHKAASLLMQSWVGLKSRQEAAKELGIPPVRIWQLSQQALSGMVAGLLHQPRRQKGMVVDPEDDPKVLRKRIRELEQDLDAAKRLIEILKDLPENRPQIIRRPPGRPKDASRRKNLPGERPPEGGAKPAPGGQSETR